jgi:hypothetical protein
MNRPYVPKQTQAGTGRADDAGLPFGTAATPEASLFQLLPAFFRQRQE